MLQQKFNEKYKLKQTFYRNHNHKHEGLLILKGDELNVIIHWNRRTLYRAEAYNHTFSIQEKVTGNNLNTLLDNLDKKLDK